MADKASELPNAERAYAVVDGTISKLIDAADVSKVYGRPIKQGDVSVIPASENLTLIGYGLGNWAGSDENVDEGYGPGGGGMGGGRTLSRPVAIIVVTPDGAYVEPVVDPTKIMMAAITAAGFMFGMLFRMMRRR